MENINSLNYQNHRISSLDQLRGVAIFGMLLVDYFENFKESWSQLHHGHNHMTMADLIAPIFMFVVGIGLRLSWIKRKDNYGIRFTRIYLVQRYVVLILIAFTLYTGYLWDALMNIGLAGLLAILVIDKNQFIRIGFGVLLISLFFIFCEFTIYGEIIHRSFKVDSTNIPIVFKLVPFGPSLLEVPINGGPLGHWSWFLMLISGTIACDILKKLDHNNSYISFLVWGMGMLIVGSLLSVEWSGIKCSWPVTKEYVTVPYSFITSGICFLLLFVFHLICDNLQIQIPGMAILGKNPLVLYIFQWCLLESAHRFLPEETHNWLGIIAGYCIFMIMCYGVAYLLYARNWVVKIG